MPAPDLPDVRPDTLHVGPLDGAETIPSSWYTDARIDAFEREAVFAPPWQFVAHADQLDAPTQQAGEAKRNRGDRDGGDGGDGGEDDRSRCHRWTARRCPAFWAEIRIRS